MENYIVQHKQTLFDVALQVYGSTDYVNKLANDNNKQIDEDLTTGEIMLYDSSIGDSLIKKNILQNSINILNIGS